MRIVYCHACGAVSTNTWGEQDRCTRCGHPAERMDYRRPWQYYVSSAVLLAAAAFFIVGPIQDLTMRLVIFLVVLIAAFALSSWGLRETRSRVLKEIARREVAEERA